MTTTATMSAQELLTYEAYMAEPQVEGRYDIINGVRIFMPGATYRHQRIAANISRILYHYEQSSGKGATVPAPFDVLIRRVPKMQTRQPDVLFISHARLEQGGGVPEIGPLPVAPELIVEIVSNSETQRILGDKIADYIMIGVEEAWIVRPDARTVEILRLKTEEPESAAVYGETETADSEVFPGLTASVAEILAP